MKACEWSVGHGSVEFDAEQNAQDFFDCRDSSHFWSSFQHEIILHIHNADMVQSTQSLLPRTDDD